MGKEIFTYSNSKYLDQPAQNVQADQDLCCLSMNSELNKISKIKKIKVVNL